MNKPRRKTPSRNTPGQLNRAQKRLGRRIAALRRQKRLSREQLGKACGVSAIKMQKLEAGDVNASLSTMIRLARQLGINLHRLFQGIQ